MGTYKINTGRFMESRQALSCLHWDLEPLRFMEWISGEGERRVTNLPVQLNCLPSLEQEVLSVCHFGENCADQNI
jgi:hypothetical protein